MSIAEVVAFDPSTQYRCAACGGVFDKSSDDDWNDDLAIEELRRNFPGVPQSDCAIVCEDCFRALGLAGTDQS